MKRGRDQGNEKEARQTLLSKAYSHQLLKELLLHLRRQENFSLERLLQAYQEVNKEILVPLSIFSGRLHPAEALCKYLRENEKLSFQEMAKFLHRRDQSLWATYQRARKRMKKLFVGRENDYRLPLSLFQNRSYSLLESVVYYLNRAHHLTNPQIAKLLHKSPNSMAVLLKRARRKHD